MVPTTGIKGIGKGLGVVPLWGLLVIGSRMSKQGLMLPHPMPEELGNIYAEMHKASVSLVRHCELSRIGDLYGARTQMTIETKKS